MGRCLPRLAFSCSGDACVAAGPQRRDRDSMLRVDRDAVAAATAFRSASGDGFQLKHFVLVVTVRAVVARTAADDVEEVVVGKQLVVAVAPEEGVADAERGVVVLGVVAVQRVVTGTA